MTPERIAVPVADEVELSVLDWGGDGGPVLLVHGLASNARLWDGVARALRAQDHRVVAVDLRGHGHSSSPPSGYDFTTMADDLTALLGHLGLERPLVAGQSMGGNLAVAWAAREPATMRAVIGVDGGAIDLQARFPDWEACAAAMTPPVLTGTPVTTFEEWMRRDHPDWSDEAIAGMTANFAVGDDGTITPHLSRDHHMAILRAIWEHRALEDLRRIEVPVVLLPSAIPLAEADLGPRVRVVPFIGADHDVHAQHPDAVAAVISAAAREAD